MRVCTEREEAPSTERLMCLQRHADERRASLIEIEVSNVEEYHVRGLFEVLPKAWKTGKSWFTDNLLHLDSKLWHSDDEIVGFSFWKSDNNRIYNQI